MADWIHSLIEAIIDVTSHLCENRTARQSLGIISGSLASFIVICATITFAKGTEILAAGWLLIVPCSLMLTGISMFCLLSDG